MTTEIIAEITAERARQVLLGFTAEHDDAHSQWEWLALLTRHIGLGVNDAATASDRYRRQLIRVAALAVAALESFDRVHQPRQALQAQEYADRDGEPWLWVEHPPPSEIHGYEGRLGYITPWSQASEAERGRGKKFEPRGKQG